jgi:hypothetical protein
VIQTSGKTRRADSLDGLGWCMNWPMETHACFTDWAETWLPRWFPLQKIPTHAKQCSVQPFGTNQNTFGSWNFSVVEPASSVPIPKLPYPLKFAVFSKEPNFEKVSELRLARRLCCKSPKINRKQLGNLTHEVNSIRPRCICLPLPTHYIS